MVKKFVSGFSYALSGFAYAFRSQFNLRFHILIMVLVVIASFILKVTAVEWCILLLCMGSVIAAELINTSLEITVDISSPGRNEKAGQAKDVAAAAVLLVSIVSGIIGLIIFIPKIILFFS